VATHAEMVKHFVRSCVLGIFCLLVLAGVSGNGDLSESLRSGPGLLDGLMPFEANDGHPTLAAKRCHSTAVRRERNVNLLTRFGDAHRTQLASTSTR
jgi:hypothetical protein